MLERARRAVEHHFDASGGSDGAAGGFLVGNALPLAATPASSTSELSVGLLFATPTFARAQ
jgi:hypothetical protein